MTTLGSITSRRRFLATTSALLGCGAARAASTPAGSGRIDVHNHYVAPFQRAFYAENGAAAPASPWSLSAGLEDMDKGGTAVAILSNLTPFDVGTPEARRGFSRQVNDYGAQLRTDHPARFGLFASLPLPDIDGCLKEIEYAFDVLHANGVAVYTNCGDRWLGHPDFAPLWTELDRRRAVVFVHPTTANCCKGLVKDVPDPVVEFGTDTTRAIASLIFSQTSTRFANIRFVFSHAGGTMPFLIERFLGTTEGEIVPGIVTKGQAPPPPLAQPPGGVLHELRRFFYDTAQASNPVALRALRTVVPTSQILFGTDYWYRTAAETAKGLRTARVFSTSELSAIEYGNARALLGL